jgi:D-arginine dehydrogenase
MARWDETQLRASVPNLKPEWTEAVYERDCCDIDVAGLHMAYLRNARRNGAVLKCNARIQEILKENEKWILKTAKESFSADVVVNAAGAWADEIAGLASVKPVGIMPLRRTMVQLRTEPPSLPEGKLIVALDGSFYFKPEAGGSYWLSPHDETETAAADVAAEELDIAIAIDRFQSVLDVEIKSVTRKWAGLRSFAPDRLPVYGFDIDQPNFFWFAGQGGFGIQTAPAAAKLAKALLLDHPLEEMVQSINTNLYDPARFS